MSTVTAPLLPPPHKPVPAITSLMSPAAAVSHLEAQALSIPTSTLPVRPPPVKYGPVETSVISPKQFRPSQVANPSAIVLALFHAVLQASVTATSGVDVVPSVIVMAVPPSIPSTSPVQVVNVLMSLDTNVPVQLRPAQEL